MRTREPGQVSRKQRSFSQKGGKYSLGKVGKLIKKRKAWKGKKISRRFWRAGRNAILLVSPFAFKGEATPFYLDEPTILQLINQLHFVAASEKVSIAASKIIPPPVTEEGNGLLNPLPSSAESTSALLVVDMQLTAKPALRHLLCRMSLLKALSLSLSASRADQGFSAFC